MIGVDRLNPFYDPFLETQIEACEPYTWSIFFILFLRNGLSFFFEGKEWEFMPLI